MLTYEEAHEWLRLDKEAGRLYWKKSRGTARAGSRAGSLNPDGYRHVGVGGRDYLEHRVIFLMVHGYFPEHGVDHLNGIRADNRPENLREVSVSCNGQNCKVQSNNTSGFPGVYWNKRDKKFQARIEIRGKTHSLGYYPTALEAALARYTAEVWDERWACNHRSELVKAIQKAWPEFKPTE